MGSRDEYSQVIGYGMRGEERMVVGDEARHTIESEGGMALFEEFKDTTLLSPRHLLLNP